MNAPFDTNKAREMAFRCLCATAVTVAILIAAKLIDLPATIVQATIMMVLSKLL